MKLLFRSFVDDEKSEYTTNLNVVDKGFSFQDKENNSLVYIFKDEDSLVLRRMGSITQELIFKEGQKTPTKYENIDGLCLDLEISTIAAKLTETGFFLHYDLLMDKKVVSNHKILGKVIK